MSHLGPDGTLTYTHSINECAISAYRCFARSLSSQWKGEWSGMLVLCQDEGLLDYEPWYATSTLRAKYDVFHGENGWPTDLARGYVSPYMPVGELWRHLGREVCEGPNVEFRE